MNKQYKLLQINSSANVGSTGRIAEQLGQIAINHGWNSYIAYGRYVNKSSSHLIKVGSKLDLIYHLFISRCFDKHGLGSKGATYRFIKKIKKIKPDVIHLHNIHGYYINYRILFEYLAKTNIPVVWTLHDCWSFTGHCAHFVTANCERWKTGCYDCPLKLHYPRSLFLDRSKQNYELKKKLFTANKKLHIITVSQWLAGIVKQSFLKEANIQVINNGIDLSVYKPFTGKRKKKFEILGVASVWTEEKGLNDFYKLNEILDHNLFEISMVGLNDQQIKKLPYGIRGIQRTNSSHELAKYYSNADVFVNPTYADTFPTVNIEAIACGTPVVTYKTGGSVESITERTGLIVETGNIEQLANAVETIRKNGKTYYSNACRKRAIECFNKDDRYEDYLNLYKRLIVNK